MAFIKYSFIILTLILAVVGCSNDPSIDSHPKEQITSPDTNSTLPDQIADDNTVGKTNHIQNTNTETKTDQLHFTKFDLEVRYGTKEYDFSYEQDHDNQYNAELNDEIHEKKLRGFDALTILHNLTKNIDLTINRPKEEIIALILNTFQLDENYTSFELEYTLKNGQEIEINDNK